MSRYRRQLRYGRIGWAAFAVCIATALLAIWLQDGRWIATSGVALLAAVALGVAGDSQR